MDEASHSTPGGEHPIDNKVLSLMDGRLEAARHLADSATELGSARAQLEDAQRAYVESFKQAEKVGWDRKELTGHLGFEEPGKAPRRRPSTRKAEPKETGRSEGEAADL
ncbi:MAG: hypothetical protein L0G46_06895 [Kocuria sp.]|nr:hypothetical protein [Kocuria sp.]